MEKEIEKLPFSIHKNGAKKSEEEFLWELKNLYGDKYDTSKVKYVNCNTDVILICPIHGEFKRTPKVLLHGGGCTKCKRFEENEKNFWENFSKNGNKDVEILDAKYVDSHTPMKCKCRVCGYIWEATPNKLLMGQGCSKCGHKKTWEKRKDRTETDTIIKRMKTIFPNYDFSKNTNIEKQKQEIIVTCPKHGDFKSTPDSILHGYGCKKCASEKLRELFSFSKEEIIKKAKEVHGDKYIYYNIEYVNIDTPIDIICPIHGKFSQSPYGHITLRQGCPICNQSHLEEEIRLYLQEKNIEFIQETKKKDLPWLGRQHLDFYLPQYKIGIECQGEQHYKPTTFSSDRSMEKKLKTLEITKERDQRKKKLCEENGIKLLYYTNYKDVEEDNEITFKDKEKLLKYINENNFTR